MSDEINDIIFSYLAGENLSTEDRLKAEVWLREHGQEDDVKVIQNLFISGQLIQKAHGVRGKERVLQIEQEVTRLLYKRKWKIHLYYSGVAVGVAILLCVALVLLRQVPMANDRILAQNIGQMKNTSKVQLKLNSGEIIELDKLQEQALLKDSVLIKNESHTLIYNSDSVTSVNVQYNTLTLPRGTEYNIVLADGTKVYLNADSEIRYPVTFVDNKREVELKGEAYFVVAKNEQQPFLVRVNDQISVRVLGTSFNVTAYPDQKRIVTTLEEGSVQVEYGEKSVNITPGEQAVYDKKNGYLKVKEVDTQLYTSWKDGYYKFSNATLEEIMETLTLWYDLNVFYVNPEVKNLEFTGRLKRYDDVKGLFKKFEDTGLVQFCLKGNNVVINKK